MFQLTQTKNKLKGLIILLITTLALHVGCASKNVGKYKRSDEVDKTFISFQVLPDHNYYFSGPSDKPEAILAVHKSHTLTSANLWSQVNPDSKQIKNWVETMRKNITHPPRAYAILTPKGKQIGVIYTPWDKGLIEMEGENKVGIGLPVKETRKPKQLPRIFQ